MEEDGYTFTCAYTMMHLGRKYYDGKTHTPSMKKKEQDKRHPPTNTYTHKAHRHVHSIISHTNIHQTQNIHPHTSNIQTHPTHILIHPLTSNTQTYTPTHIKHIHSHNTYKCTPTHINHKHIHPQTHKPTHIQHPHTPT